MYVFHLLYHLLEEQKQALNIKRSQVGEVSTLLVLGFSSGNPTLRGSMPRKALPFTLCVHLSRAEPCHPVAPLPRWIH